MHLRWQVAAQPYVLRGAARRQEALAVTVCEMNRDEVRVGRDQSCRVCDTLHEDYPHALPLYLALQLRQTHSATHTRFGLRQVIQVGGCCVGLRKCRLRL